MVLSLDDHSVADPLPELGLCGPELTAILANYSGCSFFPSNLLLLLAHKLLLDTPLPTHLILVHKQTLAAKTPNVEYTGKPVFRQY